VSIPPAPSGLSEHYSALVLQQQCLHHAVISHIRGWTRKRLSGAHTAKKCRDVWGETPCSRAGPHPSGCRSPGRDHLGEWGAVAKGAKTTVMKSGQDGHTAHPGLSKPAAQELLLRQSACQQAGSSGAAAAPQGSCMYALVCCPLSSSETARGFTSGCWRQKTLACTAGGQSEHDKRPAGR